MRIAVLFSSGKDSTFTYHYYQMQGWEIVCLCTLLPLNTDSFMFQAPLKELVEKQAAALDVPVIFQETEGEEEKELAELKQLLYIVNKKFNIDGVAVGALASDYQHVRVNHICHELGLKTFAPLWHKDQEKYMREIVDAGFDIRLTRIAAMGLSTSWLGRRLTMSDVEKLVLMKEQFGFHPAGEGGEFETVVVDAPFFRKQVNIEFEKKMESKERGELVITTVK